MLTHEIRNQLLVDELQLGNRLNQDIQTSDHADFALLLAMLSHDVTDNPEFSSSESKLKEEDLRKKFNLLPEQKNMLSHLILTDHRLLPSNSQLMV